LPSSLLLVLVVALAGDLDGAEKALAAGKAREALEALGDLADRDDADTRALIVQGRAYLALREYVAAVEPLVRASDRNPDDRALARDAAWACWGAASGVYAAAYFEDAKRMAQRSGDEMLIADLHYQTSEFATALEHYRKVLEGSPDALAVRMRVGDCLKQLDRADEARTEYAAVLTAALENRDLQAAYRAAFLAGQRGRLLKWLDDGLKEQPDNLEYLRYRGYARLAALRYVDAAEDLRRVLERTPDDLATRDRLAAALFRHGLSKGDADVVAQAEAVDRVLLDTDASNQAAWERLNWVAGWYWNNKRVDRSYELLKHLNSVDPDDITTGLNFAAMARRFGHYDEARAVYDHLLEVSPDDPAVTNDLAILVDGQGQRDEAVRLWKKVLAEDPENLNALENLLTAAWESGDLASVKDYIRRGLAASRNGGPYERWLWFQDRIRWCPSGFGA
jgi:tetratricopeptide (TPR) repeat protein